MIKEHGRVVFIDVARTVAIMMVILCHIAEMPYYWMGISFVERTTFSKFFGIFCCTLGRLGVPLFLMITGYLLLNRKYDENKAKYFYSHNVSRLLITTEIWVVIYAIMHCIIHKRDIVLMDILKEMLFIKEPTFPHMWYMTMILSVYIWIPVLSKGLELFDKLLFIPLGVSIIYIFVNYDINVLLKINGMGQIDSKYYPFMVAGFYGVYLIIGKTFTNTFWDKIKILHNIIGFGISFGLLICLQYASAHAGYHYHVWYTSALLLFASVFAFNLIRTVASSIEVEFFQIVSKYSLGIYFVHYPLKVIMYKFCDVSMSDILKTIVFWLINFSLSVLIVHIFYWLKNEIIMLKNKKVNFL